MTSPSLDAADCYMTEAETFCREGILAITAGDRTRAARLHRIAERYRLIARTLWTKDFALRSRER
jgi:hypothetical protein